MRVSCEFYFEIGNFTMNIAVDLYRIPEHSVEQINIRALSFEVKRISF